MEKLLNILNGTLLGDACILFDNYKYKKYFVYKITAKGQIFLFWLNSIFKTFQINNSWITEDKRNNTISLYFYINNCPYTELMKLRDKWYRERKGKPAQKIIPRDLKLTPTVILHWYLGDGSLIRRKNNSVNVPYIVLATNAFSKEDIDFLIQKLKELNLNFYPVKYKSGFTKKESGYCLYSKTQDGTPFRFFKLIGFECPKEIANCSTGRKGIYHEEKFFKDKWPTEEDWIKILSNVKGIGKSIKERREQINMSRKELTELLKVGKSYIRSIESGNRKPSVNKLRAILKTLDLNNLKIS
jgi:DNA-binding transcriptional regulator YiaG